MKVKAIKDFKYRGSIIKKGQEIDLEGSSLDMANKKGVVALEVKKDVVLDRVTDDEVKDAVVEFQCPYCDFVGKTESALKRHITMKHKEDKETEEVEKEENKRPRSNN